MNFNQVSFHYAPPPPSSRIFPHIHLVHMGLFSGVYLVCDDQYHKIGSVKRKRGNWYFYDQRNQQEYFGLTRDDAVLMWLHHFDN